MCVCDDCDGRSALTVHLAELVGIFQAFCAVARCMCQAVLLQSSDTRDGGQGAEEERPDVPDGEEKPA